MKPYQATGQEIAQVYSTSLDRGLSRDQAQKKLSTHGPNVLPDGYKETLLVVFLRQFQNPLIYILLIAASIIFFTGNRLDAFIISGVLFFNAIIGTIQEGRTQTLLAGLRQYLTSHCIVIRDGTKEIIQAEEVVVGDLIMLTMGERVPADARIVQAHDLKIDEAMLTGESEPAFKTTDWLHAELPLAEQKNMAFKGTYIVAGSGMAIVVATGAATEIGKLQKVAEEIQTETPIKKELDTLSKYILFLIFGVCLGLLVLGLAFGRTFEELLTMLTALFICVVPEGLPVVLTLVLVTGAYRMARDKVLPKRLQAVDTLGRTEIAIIDKTGTLTRNEMMVSQVWADGKRVMVSGVGYFVNGGLTCEGSPHQPEQTSALCMMGIAGNLMSHAHIQYVEQTNNFVIEGDPTEAAMFVFSRKIGCEHEQLEQKYKIVADMPFDPKTRVHISLYEVDVKKIMFVLGSPEAIVERVQKVDPKTIHELEAMLEQGLRVVGVAMKELDGSQSFNENETPRDLTFLGFFGIQDAIRPEVADMIAQARSSGIRVIMATGDHQKTALYVAKSVGIYHEGDEAVDGVEFHDMSDEELIRGIYKRTVYSRLTPEDKLRLVRAFHRLGKVVAMTGDGVNDAPSLVAADVGIAMGGIGTDVAKQAADVILLDDSFAHVVVAIEQGRHIFDALRRVILYFFATNFGEVLVVLFALVLNLPLPILAAQILWLNLVTDGFLDIALAMEPQEKDVLKRKRVKKGARLVDATLLLKVLYMALPMGIGSIVVFTMYSSDLAKARTMTLITMAMYQWFNAWNCRSEIKSVFQLGLFANHWLMAATALVATLQILVVNVPVLQTLFHTVPLSMHECYIVLAFTSPLFVIEELRKWWVRRYLGQ